MTSLDAALDDISPPGQIAATRWDRFEALLARLSDRLNPILVKEARQALRSRQFISTFMLMLVAGWAWSILGLAMIGPDVNYEAAGPTMFYGYHVILAFPLLIVAPFAAFHSLSSERQDRTFELVSITSLGARQILSGKLCGIMLQMMIYLSAIFPCLAFTYLLRGLDIFTIMLAVVYTCAMSLAASVTGLFFATLAPQRQRLIGPSVGFAIMLFSSFAANLTWIFGMTAAAGVLIESPEFWELNLAGLTFFVNMFAITFLAARSQLTAVSQNRSTALRVALVVAQLSMLGWAAWWQARLGNSVLLVFLFFSVALWYAAGVFLTGEPALLSPRVKRDLPQSLLGRVFLTLFAPGPGTGYLFAIANTIAMSVMVQVPFRAAAVVTPVVLPPGVGPRPIGPAMQNFAGVMSRENLAEVCLVATSYLVVYLGLGKLLLALVWRVSEAKMMTRVLIQVLLLAVGVGVPWVWQLSNPYLRYSGYSLWQITNPIWTIYECCFRGLPADMDVLVVVVPLAALGVLGLNLPSLVTELRQVRVARPRRVVEEDAALAAVTAVPPGPQNPWDQ